MNKKVWLIRHGESTANAGAATSNHRTIPLSPVGLEQAQKISLSIPETPNLIILLKNGGGWGKVLSIYTDTFIVE